MGWQLVGAVGPPVQLLQGAMGVPRGAMQPWAALAAAGKERVAAVSRLHCTLPNNALRAPRCRFRECGNVVYSNVIKDEAGEQPASQSAAATTISHRNPAIAGSAACVHACRVHVLILSLAARPPPLPGLP